MDALISNVIVVKKLKTNKDQFLIVPFGTMREKISCFVMIVFLMKNIKMNLVHSPLGGCELRLFVALSTQLYGWVVPSSEILSKLPQSLKPGGSGWAHKPQA